MGRNMEISTIVALPSTYNFVSFDIFDTLLTRKYLEPVDLFKDLEVIVVNKFGRGEGFFNNRVNAEFELRKKVNFNKDICLDEIYLSLYESLDYTRDEIDEIMNIELLLEMNSLVAINETVLAIDILRRQNKQILFVSDMYLPVDFIKKVLQKFDIYKNDDLLYVSSEYRFMKHTGELFDRILDDLNISPQELCHVGDNIKGDVMVPERLGVRAIHYKGMDLNRYEDYKNEHLLVSKLFGVAKVTRKLNLKNNATEHVIWRTTANVAAPMIFTYVNWCIQSAIENKIPVLYFLSRDGQIMYKIANLIVDKYYSEKISIKYLFVSRQSLLFPALDDLDNDAFEWIFAPTSMLSVRMVLNRINFEPEELIDLLKQFGLYEKLDIHLSKEDLKTLKNALLETKQTILDRASIFRAKALSYFKQEGLLDNQIFSVVDIGWSGTLQYSISKMLNSIGFVKPVYGMYFGVKRRKLFKNNDLMFSWFTDHNYVRPLDKKVYIIPMTELFTAADHGGVIRYETDVAGKITSPVLKSEKNISGIRWGVHVQQEAMLKFTNLAITMLSPIELDVLSKNTIDLIEENYQKFLLYPAKDEAEVYCDYDDAEDQNESYRTKMGRPYHLEELHKFFANDFMHHHNEWRQGSLALSNQRFVDYAWHIYCGSKH